MGITKRLRNRRWLLAALLLVPGLPASVYAARHLVSVGGQPDGSIVVPTGQTLTPAGVHIDVNDRPLGMVVSPAGTELAVVTGSNFSARALHIIDLSDQGAEADDRHRQQLRRRRLQPGRKPDLRRRQHQQQRGASSRAPRTARLPPRPRFRFPARRRAGLRVSPDGARLYVALNTANQVAVIDTAARAIVARVPVGELSLHHGRLGRRRKVYVSNWGGRVPGASDVTDGMFPIVVDPRTGIPVSGTVSVIDTATQHGDQDDRRRAAPDRHGAQPARRPRVRHQRQQRHGVGHRHARPTR